MLLSHTDGETMPDGARVEEVKMPVWQRQLGMRDDKKVWGDHMPGAFLGAPSLRTTVEYKKVHSTIIVPQGFERQMPAEPETQPLMVESGAFLPRSLLTKVSVMTNYSGRVTKPNK